MILIQIYACLVFTLRLSHNCLEMSWLFLIRKHQYNFRDSDTPWIDRWQSNVQLFTSKIFSTWDHSHPVIINTSQYHLFHMSIKQRFSTSLAPRTPFGGLTFLIPSSLNVFNLHIYMYKFSKLPQSFFVSREARGLADSWLIMLKMLWLYMHSSEWNWLICKTKIFLYLVWKFFN